MSRDRQSNIEALRLLLMLMVLNLHSFWGFTHGSGFLQALDFFRESTSVCAVDAFIITSGYFSIRWKAKSFFNLVFQLFFYSFGIYLVAVQIKIVPFTISGLLNCATCLYSFWDFMTGYLLLYLFSPLLNIFVEKVSSKNLLGYIIILMISVIVVTRNFGHLDFFTLYLIGRYIRLNGIVGEKRLPAGWYYWITTVCIFILVYFPFKYFGFDNPELIHSVPWGFSYQAPLVILQAVFLFLFFARKDFHSKAINWCAASCLAVFLIHMHPTIKQVGYYAITEQFYELPPLDHAWRLAVLIVIVFFGSILIDKIRILISDLLYRFFAWIISFFKHQESGLENYIPNLSNHD